MKISIPRIEVVRLEYCKANIVPNKYKDYLVDMNCICAEFSSDIFHGRDKEIRRIIHSLLKTQNTNVMLLGNNGVGKNIVVQTLVTKVINKKCPKQLLNCHFIYWDIEKILASLSIGSDKAIKNINDSFKFLTSYEDIVVVIDQVHLIATSTLLLYYFSVLLKMPDVKVIGITTEDEFYSFFNYSNKIIASVDIIHINEPQSNKVYPMICDYIKVIEKHHGVTISEDLINYTVSVSAAFLSEMSNPGLAVDFIEKSMIIAKSKKHTEVTKNDINSNFNFNYELYNKMSYEDKRMTAYHEAGHFIVQKFSEHIKNYRTTAISIVPAEHFLGVTMFEFEPEKQTSCDEDYFVDNIAVDLAGRAAETLLKEAGEPVKFTSGAYSDIKNATSTARDIITEYGMLETCGKNMTYFCNYDLSDLALLSEKTKNLIDDETNKLIERAYKHAESILNEKRELLELISSELLKNDVLDEKDLNKLCAQVTNN